MKRTLLMLVLCTWVTSNPATGQDQEILQELEKLKQAMEKQENKGVTVKTVVISGSTRSPGVVMQGLPGDPITDARGQYHAIVRAGWSGTVTPVRPGYNFEPQSRTYAKISKDQQNMDYLPRILTFTISGNMGVEGVVMKGLPGEPITDANGRYSVQAPYGWAGIVTPVKEGHIFSPPSRRYDRMTANLDGENYETQVILLTISDRIVFSHGPAPEPITGVTVTAEPGGWSATSDAKGRYTIQVPYGWSGKLVFSRDGFAFDPPSTSYTNVTDNIIHQDDSELSPPERDLATRPPRMPGRYQKPLSPLSADEILVIPTERVAPEEFAQTSEDMRVMAHILREELSEPRTIRGVLYDYGDFFGWPDRAVEAIYLQGYGVLFTVRLDVPLSFRQEPSRQEQDASAPVVDPVWQRARETLHGQRSDRRRWTAEEDQMTFEHLKEDLLGTLKHAANIRRIDPNERVILTVIGQADPTDTMISGRGGAFSFGTGASREFGTPSSYSYPNRSAQRRPENNTPSQAGAASTTVLTIQATKADVDAFAKGETDFEQFQEKTRIFSY